MTHEHLEKQALKPALPERITKKLPPWVREDAYLMYGVPPKKDLEGSYIRQKPVSVQEQALADNGFELYRDGNTRIVYPENPLIPVSEGTHVRIVTAGVSGTPKTVDQWRDWTHHAYVAIGMGKAFVEQSAKETGVNFLWGNAFAPDAELTTDIIVRNVDSPSWGKTAPIPEPGYNHRDARLPHEQLHALKSFTHEFFRTSWGPQEQEIAVFPHGVTMIDKHTPAFQKAATKNPEEPYFWKNDLLAMLPHHKIFAVPAAHVPSGVHFMMETPGKPNRPWENVNRALESLMIAEVVRQLVTEEDAFGSKIAAKAYVRATGSWLSQVPTMDIDPVYEAKFSVQGSRVLKEGVLRQDREVKFVAAASPPEPAFHPHVLGVRHSDEALSHFKRSIDRGDEEWKRGMHLSPMEVSNMSTRLYKELPKRLPKIIH